MPADASESTSNVFVAAVGSRPLVLYVDNWVPGTVEPVTYNDEPVTYNSEPVTHVVV
jgi:hypothetical protein